MARETRTISWQVIFSYSKIQILRDTKFCPEKSNFVSGSHDSRRGGIRSPPVPPPDNLYSPIRKLELRRPWKVLPQIEICIGITWCARRWHAKSYYHLLVRSYPIWNFKSLTIRNFVRKTISGSDWYDVWGCFMGSYENKEHIISVYFYLFKCKISWFTFSFLFTFLYTFI